MGPWKGKERAAAFPGQHTGAEARRATARARSDSGERVVSRVQWSSGVNWVIESAWCSASPPREEEPSGQSQHDTSWFTSVPSKETYIF